MRRPEGSCPGCWQPRHPDEPMCFPAEANVRHYGDPDEDFGFHGTTDRLESYMLDITNPQSDTRRGAPGFVIEEAKAVTARLRAAIADGTLTAEDFGLPAAPAPGGLS